MKPNSKNKYFYFLTSSIIFVLLMINFCFCLTNTLDDSKKILDSNSFYSNLSLSVQEIREIETSKHLQKIEKRLKSITSNEKEKKQKAIKEKILQENNKSRFNNKVIDDNFTENITILKIENNGNIVLSISGQDFFKAGYKYGDYVSVTINNKIIEMPVCKNYSDVACGNSACVVSLNNDTNDDKVVLAINNGDFSTLNDIAVKESLENNQYKWKFNKNNADNQIVTIDLILTKNYDDYEIFRTNNREDYNYLSDEEFANFRVLNSNKIRNGIIYRSSTPIWGNIGRNDYCLEAMQKYGIKTIINLFDDNAVIDTYKIHFTNYYCNQDIFALKLNNYIRTNEFKEDLKKVLQYIINSKSPYLIHCNDGIDSTGIICAIIQSLIGCSSEEIINEYMISYYNYYNILPNTEYYDALAKVLIVKPLSLLFNEDVSSHPNLSELCENYLISIGMTDNDVKKIKSIIAK